jgi:4,5-DOPA dioxygenase extradiol
VTKAYSSPPAPEHYLPLLYVLGAQRENETAVIAVDGTELGSIGMLSIVVDGSA